jgi:hypothetical protein
VHPLPVVSIINPGKKNKSAPVNNDAGVGEQVTEAAADGFGSRIVRTGVYGVGGTEEAVDEPDEGCRGYMHELLEDKVEDVGNGVFIAGISGLLLRGIFLFRTVIIQCFLPV